MLIVLCTVHDKFKPVIKPDHLNFGGYGPDIKKVCEGTVDLYQLKLKNGEVAVLMETTVAT